MSFEGSRYYVLALQLVLDAKNSPDPEVWLRAAIGRAYYAALLKARDFLRDKEHDTNIPTDGYVHTYVREKFRSSTDPKRKGIGTGLRDLRNARNLADYGYDLLNLDFIAPLLVAQAGTILADIDSI